jgi:hypothetical protein
MHADDGRRSNVGVVASVVATEGGRIRLCFDDVAAKSTSWPQEWRTNAHFTSLECDAEAVLSINLSEQQLADIGLALVSRLAALSKA